MIPLEAWLHEVQRQGVKMGLHRMRAALDLCGSPQASFPSLLIGGTNGKGSTVCFSQALLSAAGHRVGSTMSPHLVAFRERFLLDGVPIDVEALETIGATVQSAVRGAPGMEELTWFELGVLLAVVWFREQAVDAAVVEVGMGGELDASSTVAPLVTAIVTVDLDHQRFLGDDVATIAQTKARAVVEGTVLVTTETRPEQAAVLERVAHARGARLVLGQRDFHWSRSPDGSFSYEGPDVPHRLRLDGLQLGPAGAHQAQNAACALAATELFCAASGLTPPSPWEAGPALSNLKVAGRLERRRSGPGGPVFLLDGAHNPAGAAALAQELGSRRRPPKRIWLLACMEDKDIAALLQPLLPHVDSVVCTRGLTSPRFAAPTALAQQVREAAASLGRRLDFVEVAETPEESLKLLMQRASGRDEVLVSGSLYLVGDVRRLLDLPGVLGAGR